MNGTIRDLDMNKEAEFCKIIEDKDNLITDWVSRGLGENDSSWAGEHYTVGFSIENKLAGGLVYHNLRPHCDVWWSIYTVNKKWCNRRILTYLFNLAFEILNCRRISILVNTNNVSCLKLVEKLGFEKEGCLRRFRENGDDCFIMGMLKENCNWKENK